MDEKGLRIGLYKNLQLFTKSEFGQTPQRRLEIKVMAMRNLKQSDRPQFRIKRIQKEQVPLLNLSWRLF